MRRFKCVEKLDAVGGLVNATCGNATELIIAMFALHQNKVNVLKFSLLGSILSNLLLVLGTSFLFGGLSNLNKQQTFNLVINSSFHLFIFSSFLFPTTVSSFLAFFDVRLLMCMHTTGFVFLLFYGNYRKWRMWAVCCCCWDCYAKCYHWCLHLHHPKSQQTFMYFNYQELAAF